MSSFYSSMSDDIEGTYVSAMNKQPSKIYVAKRIKRRQRRSSGSSSSSSSSSDDDSRRRDHSKVTLLRKVVDEPRVKLVPVVRPEVQEVSVVRRTVAPEVNVVRAVVPEVPIVRTVVPEVPVVRRVVQEAPVLRRMVRSVPTETVTLVRKVSDRSARSPSRLVVPRSTGETSDNLYSLLFW